MDTDDSFEDPGDEVSRVVRDQCEWELVPDANSTSSWDFHYKYEAFISDAEEGRESIASQKFNEKTESISEDFSDVSSQGEESLADRSYYTYGETSPGVTGYYLVAQTRSAVYEINLSAEGEAEEGGAVSLQSLKHEVEKIVDVSEIEFNIWIPE